MQQTRIMIELEVYYESLYLTILTQIGDLHQYLEEYDEALSVYEDELLPRILKFERSQDLGQAYSDLANIYRSKGEYKKGLELLEEAQMVYREIGANMETYLERNTEAINEMREIIDISEKQDRYITKVFETAQRWQFTTRLYNLNASDERCPAKARIRRKDRFYRPPEYLSILSIMTAISLLVKFTLGKPSRLRVAIAGVVSGLLLFISGVALSWSGYSYLDKLNVAAEWNLLLGKHERALEVFDEARCAILTNPYEESVITTACALDTFAGAIFVYMDLGVEYHTIDRLAADIDNLIEANSVLGPSVSTLTLYWNLHQYYSKRGDVMKSKKYSRLVEIETKRLTDTAAKEAKKLSDPKNKKPLNKTLYTGPELYEDQFEDLKIDIPRDRN